MESVARDLRRCAQQYERGLAMSPRMPLPVLALQSPAQQPDDSEDVRAKLSLGFILNRGASNQVESELALAREPQQVENQARPELVEPAERKEHIADQYGRQAGHTASISTIPQSGRSSAPAEAAAPARANTRSNPKSTSKGKLPAKKGASTYEEKRMSRKCTIEGCFNYTINRGRCFRHGGGKQCTVEGCTASAKIAGLCWKHGGSIQCVVEGCDRRGKSRGRCWAHGGGTKCTAGACTKVAVSNGLCWAHGGGKRCIYDGCQRPAYERTFNYCNKHYARLHDGKETVEV